MKFKNVELIGFKNPQLAISTFEISKILFCKFQQDNISKQYDFGAWGIETYCKKGAKTKRKNWVLKQDAERIANDPKIFIRRVSHHHIPVRHNISKRGSEISTPKKHSFVDKTKIYVSLIICTTILAIAAMTMAIFK